MKASFDPIRLDVAAFAKAGERLEGLWPLKDLGRLASSVPADAALSEADVVSWRVEGELRQLRGGAQQVWVHLQAQARVPLECQRCLKPVVSAIQAERSFLFVDDEDTAAQLDADLDEDVLTLTRALDLRELVEDELLLELPLVPRHEVCPDPLPLPDEPPVGEDAPHPFAALAALKRGNLPN